ncbi:MAG: hypothetical protein AAGI08_00140 [Bacteroidota bacterium]
MRDGRYHPGTNGQLASALGGSEGLFSARFIRSPGALGLVNGDLSVVADENLRELVRQLVVGTVSVNVSPHPGPHEDWHKGEAVATVRVVDTRSMSSRTVSVRTIGGGFSAGSAETNVVDKLTANLAQELR